MVISRGRTTQRARSVSSIWDRVSDQTPILRMRLVDESGESITGGRAMVGRATRARRSWTSARASIRSVPDANKRTMDVRPSTERERSCVTPGRPPSEASIGVVTSASTSSLERPGASTWISTRGGANSGKASNEASDTTRVPSATRSRTRPTTTQRCARQRLTSARIVNDPGRIRCRTRPLLPR
jgi:hypothetical protein